MNQSRPSVKSLFDAALEIESPQERDAFLAQIAADDVDLHQKVAALLVAYFNAGSFLEAPAVARTIDMPAAASIAEAPGSVIGPYKLLQQLGEGGMGVVYMAEQAAPVRRKVALKIIKAGMDTREVIARFEAERQALALMDHPNIARVFEAGATQTGRPFFVMELVRGVPITDYCDQNNLPVHERLELFVTVCHAVQHAHQKGIIHRDIKPSNVLVTLHDGRPVPKVIDFGVAKAIGQQLTDKTLFTQFAQMVGTPLYMSPEQAQLTGVDVDTRGDIYSLGVMLYELLTGTTPFEGGRMKQVALDEIRRMIREEEPPSPSMRLSSTAGAAQTAVAAHRHIDHKGLSKLLRGDLDWIVMKALEKDRTRRYETANGFAADIGRYLSDEPVEACPPSAAYRLRKFIRRNRAGLVTTSLLGVALLVATSAIGWTIRDRSAEQADMDRQRVEQKLEAERERAATRQQSEQERLARQARLEGRISEALDEVQAEYERDKLPEAIAAVKQAERLLTSGDVGHDELRERVGHWEAELEVLQRLEDLGFRFSRDQSVETDIAYVKVFRDLGIDVEELPVEEAGKRIRSHVTWQHLTEALDRWAGIRHEMQFLQNARPDATLRKQRLLQVARAADADDLRTQARLAVEAGDLETADGLAGSPQVSRLPASTLNQLAKMIFWAGGDSRREMAVRLLENARIERAGDFQLHVACANFYGWMDPPHWPEAAHYASIALAIRPGDARVQGWLAYFYEKHGKLNEAIAYNRQAIELDPKLVAAHINLGVVLNKQGKPDEAIASYREAIELDPKYGLAHRKLGFVLNAQGKPDEAIACYRKAIELDPNDTLAHVNLGSVLNEQGKPDEAIAYYRKAIELDPNDALAHVNLGSVLNKQGKPDEAIASYREAIKLDPKNALTHKNLGVVLNKQGKPDEAIACYRQAIELDSKYALAHNDLGVVLHEQGKLDEAIACFHKAIGLDPKCALAHKNLGIVLNQQGKPDEAIACYRKAVELDPKSASASDHRDLGTLLKRQSKLDEALIEYAKALKLSPADWGIWDDRGMVYVAQGQPEKAIADFTQSIAIHSEAWWVWQHRGLSYRALGQWEEALADFSKVIELAPEDAEIWRVRGEVRGHLNQWKGALADREHVLELTPESDSACTELAWILATCPELKLRNPRRALELAKKAVELAPKNGTNRIVLGIGHYRAGDWKPALEALETALPLRNGGDCADCFFLAMVHWQLGDKAKARQWFDQGDRWMADHHHPDWPRLRSEAADLLEVKDKTD